MDSEEISIFWLNDSEELSCIRIKKFSLVVQKVTKGTSLLLTCWAFSQKPVNEIDPEVSLQFYVKCGKIHCYSKT